MPLLMNVINFVNFGVVFDPNAWFGPTYWTIIYASLLENRLRVFLVAFDPWKQNKCSDMRLKNLFFSFFCNNDCYSIY